MCVCENKLLNIQKKFWKQFKKNKKDCKKLIFVVYTLFFNFQSKIWKNKNGKRIRIMRMLNMKDCLNLMSAKSREFWNHPPPWGFFLWFLAGFRWASDLAYIPVQCCRFSVRLTEPKTETFGFRFNRTENRKKIISVFKPKLTESRPKNDRLNRKPMKNIG